MKLINYLLNEKVSMSDFNAILADTKFRVGVEYEMISNDLVDNPVNVETIDEYNQLLSEYEDFVSFYQEDFQEWENEGIDAKNERIQSIQDEIDELDADEDADEIKEKTKEKDRIEDLETYEYMEEFSEDDGLIEEYDFVERNPYSSLLEIGKNLEEYWSFNVNDPQEKVNNIIWDIVNENAEVDEFIRRLEEEGLYIPNEEGSETTPNNIKDQLETDNLPFNDFIIGFYHQHEKETSKWRIEPDSSLSTGGVEIISPIQTIQQSLQSMEEMFNYIKQHGHTDSSTGLHITISHPQMASTMDPLKLLLFTDEKFIFKLFSERETNEYSKKSEYNIYKSNIIDDPKKYNNLIKILPANKLRTKIKDLVIPSGRENAVNLTNIFSNNPRVEFRYAGGSNYETKYAEVRLLMLRYAQYMKLAMDPEYKKDEYRKKLFKLLDSTTKEIVDSDKNKEVSTIKLKGTIIKTEPQKDITWYQLNGIIYKIAGGKTIISQFDTKKKGSKFAQQLHQNSTQPVNTTLPPKPKKTEAERVQLIKTSPLAKLIAKNEDGSEVYSFTKSDGIITYFTIRGNRIIKQERRVS